MDELVGRVILYARRVLSFRKRDGHEHIGSD